jgi:hypothetical protein
LTIKKNSFFLRNNIVLFVLISGLFYPAMLGAYFFNLYEFWSKHYLNINLLVALLIGVVLVVFFAVDYLYSLAHERSYCLIHFVLDIVVISLVFFALRSVRVVHGTVTGLKTLYILIGVIHFLFLIWDIFLRQEDLANTGIAVYDSITLVGCVGGFIWMYKSSFGTLSFLFVVTVVYSYFVQLDFRRSKKFPVEQRNGNTAQIDF